MSQTKSFRLPAMLLSAPLVSAAFAGQPARGDELAEVIVTGTLRAQPLQEVPASVTVLDAATLRDAGQQHFQDVLELVPNLNWAAGTSRPRYFQIRGIGEREQYEGAPNPSVGFLIDDIDFSGLGMPATLFDIGQIEVLRGPQGTHHGANALAGLIVVRSNDPEPEAAYALEASAGDHGMRSIGASATGPVAGNSAWRLSVQQYDSDGFLDNAALDRDDTNARDELSARFKWRSWLARGGLLDVTLLHADLDNGYDGWSLDNSRTTQTDAPGIDRQRAQAASLRWAQPLASGNVFTTIGSFARSKTLYGYDYDWGNPAFWQPHVYDGVEDWDRTRRTGSLEVRLASPDAGDAGGLGWLVGAYALRLDEEGRYTSIGNYEDPVDPDWNWSDERVIDDDYEATSLALFGQLDGRLNAAWRWSAGLRLEQRSADYRDAGEVNGEAQASDFDARDRMLGGQLALTRHIGAASNVYAQVSRGYKAGGFNLGGVPDELRDFGPEYLWNFESGWRTLLGEGRGRADVAVFYQRRKDQQVRSGRQLAGGGPYEFVTINLPRGYTTGVEASLQYQLVPSLAVGGSLGLLRSRSGPVTGEDGEPIASRENAHAPSYTAAAHVTWRHPSGFFVRVDGTAMDDFYFDVPTDHDQKAGSHALAHVKLGFERGGWRVDAWVRNVFDRQYAVRGFFFGNDPREGWENRLYRQYGDPRHFGVTASVQF